MERGIQDEERQVRTIKLALESNIGERIPSDHSLVPWLIEYASVLLNRGQVGKDGKNGLREAERKAGEFGTGGRRKGPLMVESSDKGSEAQHGFAL